MSRPNPFRFLQRVALVAPLLLLPGCMRSTARIEEKEENHPRYREGKARMQQGEYDDAIRTFEALLRENPSMARPHLELGVLYDERKKDYVRAIYHYQAYLELRPESDKRKWLEQAVNHAKMSFVGTFPMSPPAAREMEQAKAELEALRVQNRQLLDALRKHSGPLPTPVPSPLPNPAPGPVPEPPAPPAPVPPQPPDTYAVQSGDTLGKIAMKVYGDSSKWNRIYEANKSSIPDKKSLKIGQPLLIPR
ncbi:MAG: tetratricopeptide repeat protein [Kiritimatiellia bacterium]